MAMQSESYKAHEPSEPPARRHPDEQAMLLMMRVVERVEVAKSFAKIATGIVAGAAVQLRAAADTKMVAVVEREGGLRSRLDRVRKIAKAATDAAVHVATRKAGADQPADPAAEES